MQDFTKMVTTREINPLIQVSSDKAHEKWLNKDRIWNLVFCILSVGGWQLTAFLNDKTLSFFTAWLTILGIPLLIRHFNKTTFIKDTIFINNEGRELDIIHNLPDSSLVIISTVALAFLTGAILDSKLLAVPDILGFVILITVIFAIPTLFFIFKNCPIAILFNYKFWTLKAYLAHEGAGSSCSSSNNNAYYERMRDNSIFSDRPESIWINHRKY